MEVLIVGIVFAVVGVPFIWLAMRTFARDRAIARWPRTDGVMIAATLTASRHRVTDKNTGSYSYTTMYTPNVRYAYSVGGQQLEGTNIARSVDGTAMSEKAATKLTNEYAPQTKVSVLYDPTDPKVAYLEVRLSIGACILLGLGCVLVVIGALVINAWRSL